MGVSDFPLLFSFLEIFYYVLIFSFFPAIFYQCNDYFGALASCLKNLFQTWHAKFDIRLDYAVKKNKFISRGERGVYNTTIAHFLSFLQFFWNWIL